jgi:hypothetical protein
MFIMTDHSENRLNVPTAAEAIQAFAKRTIAVQSEVSEKLMEASKHWLEQIHAESNAAWELFRKINTTTSATERVATLQDWLKGVTARRAEDATYAIQTARVLGNIELNLFTQQTDDTAETSRKAA